MYSSCTLSQPLDTKLSGSGCTFNTGEIGSSFAVADINGDGYPDLIIGASSASPGGNWFAGSVYVIYGTATGIPALNPCADLNGINGFELDGISSDQYTGTAVAVGDINGDGIADLIIGANAAGDPSNPYNGSVYVVFGGSTMKNGTAWSATNSLTAGGSIINGSNGFRLDDPASDGLGTSVATGDFNKDGYYDMAIGAPFNGNTGQVYIVPGKASGWSATQTLQ